MIGIIRYLLGSDSPHSPKLIDNAVSWYALRAGTSTNRFFVAHPALHGAQSSTDVMLVLGDRAVPSMEDLEANTNVDGLRSHLASLIGLESNENVPEDGQTRRPLTANFKHSLYYCFQEQGEIANARILFHHQDREFQAQAIKDTLPYFLGAQGPLELELREQLRVIRRQIKVAEQRIGTLEGVRINALSTATGLMSQARS